jgi:hypothetical protein
MCELDCAVTVAHMFLVLDAEFFGFSDHGSASFLFCGMVAAFFVQLGGRVLCCLAAALLKGLAVWPGILPISGDVRRTEEFCTLPDY